MKSLSLILIACLLLESCSFGIKEYLRMPASIERIGEIEKQLLQIKQEISGKEGKKNCSEADVENNFQSLVNSLKKNSCKENDFSIDYEAYVEKKCPVYRIDGLLAKFSKRIINLEQDKNKNIFLKLENESDLNSIVNKGLELSIVISNLLNESRIASDEKVKLINLYYDNFLLPLREVYIVTRSYSNDYLENKLEELQLTLDDESFSDFNENQKSQIKDGPSPETLPFYLTFIEDKKSDKRKITFDRNEIIRRDIITLLKEPTFKNYLMALKWMTIHMMTSQVNVYNNVLGMNRPINIPQSCQNKENGYFPGLIKFNKDNMAPDEVIENILANHGLIFKSEDSSYMDYYIENQGKDPTKDGYSGLIPFENYKISKIGSSGKNLGIAGAQFDDIAHFQSIFNFKAGKSYGVFKDIEKIKNKNTNEKVKVTYNGFDTFQKMLTGFATDEVAEIKLKDGSTRQIYPGKQNISQYVLDLMKEEGVDDYSSLITNDLKSELQKRIVLLDFPSLYSSPVWRDWSLKLISNVVHRYRDLPTNSQIHKFLFEACTPSQYISSPNDSLIREVCVKGNKLENLDKILSELEFGDEYVPIRRLESKKIESIYPLLASLWKNLRDQTELLPEAKLDEYSFLTDQLSASNPWARLRLSYLLFNNKFESKLEGSEGGFLGLFSSSSEKCDSNQIKFQFNKIKRASNVLGIDAPLTNNYSTKMLSNSEKEIVWKQIQDDFEKRNANLFSVENNKKSYYQEIEDLSYKTILNSKDAILFSPKISKKSQDEIKSVSDSNNYKLSEFFLKLYKLKGNVEKQEELFESFSKVNGIDNNFNLKLNFLAVDESFKKPIYKDFIRQAAQTRKNQILTQLENFCELDVNNPKDFKTIFYSTTKSQNELNQMSGLPTIPADVLKKINEMTPEEFKDMWMGIGSGVLGMASVVVGGACIATTGGICTPLAGAMVLAGVSSIGMQMKLTSNELNRKFESDENEIKVKRMEELGFADLGSSDEVHRSFAWTAIEAASILPMIEIASKAVTLGPKLGYIGVRSLMNKNGELAFKSAAKTAVEEEDVRLARYLLGFESISKNLGLDMQSIEKAKGQISKIKSLYASDQIDYETMMKQISRVLSPLNKGKFLLRKNLKAEIGKVFVLESKSEIDQKTAKLISTYFSDNPKSMARLLSSYSGERLNKAIKAMSNLGNPKIIGNRIPIYRGLKSWFVRLRNESLAKNGDKILRIEKELQNLSNAEGKLTEYVLKNIEELTDIFMNIPLRKRELPYILQIQGMPIASIGKKIPILSTFSEGQVLKKIFQSRSRLVYESYKAEASRTLGLKKYVNSVSTYGVFKAFKESIQVAAYQGSSSEAEKLVDKYIILEDMISKKLYKEYISKGNKIELNEFNKIVFNPSNIKERALAETIWSSVPADELLRMKELSEVAHKAVIELSNYNNVDTFEYLLTAFKMRILNRDPVVLDVI